MRPVTMEVGWPSTGVKRRGWDWAEADERRKEKGERRKERYMSFLLIRDCSWGIGDKDTKSEGGMQVVGNWQLAVDG
jgi:hypothetical protein